MVCVTSSAEIQALKGRSFEKYFPFPSLQILTTAQPTDQHTKRKERQTALEPHLPSIQYTAYFEAYLSVDWFSGRIALD